MLNYVLPAEAHIMSSSWNRVHKNRAGCDVRIKNTENKNKGPREKQLDFST